MALIDIEDIALLEDEVSILRSENEFLRLTVDALKTELPDGFEWEYRTADNGGGSYSQHRSETILPTVYRRAVGPWVVHRPRKVIVHERKSD